MPEFINQSTIPTQASSYYFFNAPNIPPPTITTSLWENEIKRNETLIEALTYSKFQPLLIDNDKKEKYKKFLELSRMKTELYEKLFEQQKFVFSY